MWNLGRSCRDATIGSLQSNRRKSFELSSKIRELMATFQAAGFPEHKPDRSGVSRFRSIRCALFSSLVRFAPIPCVMTMTRVLSGHIHPIPPPNKLVRSISYEWTIGIVSQVRFIKTGHIATLPFKWTPSSHLLLLCYISR